VHGPPTNSSVTVVFVHVGSDITHGKHLFFSVAQVRRSNPQISIAVVMSKGVSENGQVRSHLQCHGVEIWVAEDVENSPATSQDLEKFRRSFVVSGDMGVLGNPKDFNFRTSARMLYVLGFMKLSGRRNVFHVENDNLIFVDLLQLADTIVECGITMASGRRNHIELALGFFFATHAEPLQKLVDFWNEQYQSGKGAMQQQFAKHFGVPRHDWLNDMSLTALYHKFYPGHLSILPSSNENKEQKSQCVYDKLQFIFDAGNLAIWHYGDFQDGKPHTNRDGWGSYKEFDPRPWDIGWCRHGACTSPYLHKNDGKSVRVGHLHVHSKRLPIHTSSCFVKQVGLKDHYAPDYVEGIAKSFELQTQMLGDINLMERLGAPGRHRDGTSWQVGGRDRRPSYPFVSGDGFRGACTWHCGDYAVGGLYGCNIKPEYVQEGDCVFIEMTDFGSGAGTATFMKNFFELVLPKIDKRIVVVTHNGDMTVPENDVFWRKSEPQQWPQYAFEKHLADPKILHWFAVNCLWASHETRPKPSKLTCIPIGVENRQWRDPSRYIPYMRKLSSLGDPKKLILTEISTFKPVGMKPERQHLASAVSAMGFVTKMNRGSFAEWADAVQQHKFVICPWGHGLDTHRTWEILLLGRFPVVRSSSLDSLYVGLPVLVVGDWKDITVQLLSSAHHQFQTESSLHLEKLFFGYWQQLILSYQQLTAPFPPST